MPFTEVSIRAFRALHRLDYCRKAANEPIIHTVALCSAWSTRDVARVVKEQRETGRMSSFIPAGRLSAVRSGQQKIEIQTEFSKYPEPRIATAVSIDGRVIHKIQKQWGKQIDTVEEMHVVEELINKQHNEVTELVQEHAATLLSQSKATAQHDSPHEVLQKVTALPDVETAFVVTADGQLLSLGRVTRDAELLAQMIGELSATLFEIARIADYADCDDCILSLGSHDLLLLPYQGGYLAALAEAKVRKRELFEELWKIARVA